MTSLTASAFGLGRFFRRRAVTHTTNVIYRAGIPADLAVAQWLEQHRRTRLEQARAKHEPSRHLVGPWILATARLAAVESRYV